MKIALAGNPNAGKTTLFNVLTGSNQFVGNWPGVTVEKKEGTLKGHKKTTVTDLPGIYSLSPYTMEEVVARNYLINERPDGILNLVDGTNIERNLYLTTQLMELGIPMVIAINMMDVVRKRGDKFNIEELSNRIGCRIVEISALKETGIDEAIEAIQEEIKKGKKRVPKHIFSGEVEHTLAHIEEAFLHEMDDDKQRWYAIKIFERDKKVIEELQIPKDKLKHIESDIKATEKELDDDSESIITNERYFYVTEKLKGVYKRRNVGKLTTSDKIDRILTNRWLALPIFALIMFLVYFVSITTVGSVVSEWMSDGLFGKGFNFFGKFVPGIPVLVERGLTSLNCVDWFKGLVINGIIKGVGSVLSFVPQMFVLFIFLAFLEACGYMSRIAFIMDKVLRKFGLSGKSFIPILIGTGCGVPGIMASRTIENERDRRITIMTTTFIPCGAKLPVIAMIAGNLFNGAAWVAPSAYFAGIAAIIISGVILKKTKAFIGEASPFVLEMPNYHMPTLINVLRSMWERGWSFIKKAGTLILLSSIIIWAGSVFGKTSSGFGFDDNMNLENSILGYIGKGLKWIFVPLGFGNIPASIATFMGILAKEEIVSVFGVLNFEGFTKLSGYSFLIFNLLCAPCIAAIGAIKKEMNSTKWTFAALGYQCGFAYAVSLCIYQLGSLITGKGNIPGTVSAVIILICFGYMIFRKTNFLCKFICGTCPMSGSCQKIKTKN